MTDREALIDVFERLDINYRTKDGLPGPQHGENAVHVGPGEGYLGFRCSFEFDDDGSFDHLWVGEI